MRLKVFLVFVSFLLVSFVIADLSTSNESDTSLSTGITDDVVVVSEYHECKRDVIHNIITQTTLYAEQIREQVEWNRETQDCADLKKMDERNEVSAEGVKVDYPNIRCGLHALSFKPKVTAVDNSEIEDSLIYENCNGLSTNAGISNEEANNIISANSIGGLG